MLTGSPPGRRYQFGTFAYDPQAKELRKRGVKIRLKPQAALALEVLLERPGEVVTREELRKRLWPSDTFVDFEHRLNAAVSGVREALGDSAEKPRYIETLSRRGYRFIGELEPAPEIVPASSVPPPLAAIPTGPVIQKRLAYSVHVYRTAAGVVMFSARALVDSCSA